MPLPNFRPVAAAALLTLGAGQQPASAQAATETPGMLPGLAHCAEIGAAADRLACYDRLAGRAPAVEADTDMPVTSSLLAPLGGVLPVAADPDERPSLLSKFWELDAADKRGIFNFVGYRPNYVLPIHYTSRINRLPQSPTQAAVPQPNYRREEAKFQLSLRTKLAQDLLLPGGDLWASFTLQALWQIWNGADSKPFRNSDYEPELSYVLPTPKVWRELPFGWQWRHVQLGLAHQSNGQSDPLSRSWNRINLSAGFERGDWSLITRLTQRIKEPLATDNNPDMVNFRGRGDLQLNWAHGKHAASLLYRSTLKNVKYGALQLEWTYPVYADQPNGLRWYLQLFRGYGETLTDYNFRQTSLGAGLSFLQF